MRSRQAEPRIRGALYLEDRPRQHSRRRAHRPYVPPQATRRRRARGRWLAVVLVVYVALVVALAWLVVTLLSAQVEVPV
ncbi:MAG TPA: hypothetical protein VKD28_02025 [Gemmatimonadales bacterium]|nr:hypothetical protein [Gemmatimonadales bacterium]